MVVNLIPSFGSFGSKLISPIVLRASPPSVDPPNWELYNGTPAKLPEEYAYCNEDVLFPPPYELVKKDATVFHNFLSTVKSLKVRSPVYDEFVAQNTILRDQKRYSLGPAGERMLLRSNWVANDIRAVGGRVVNIDGATFYIEADKDRSRLHWLTDGMVFTYEGLDEGVAFLENTNVLENQNAVRELIVHARRALTEAGRKPFIPMERTRRRLGREITFV